MIPSFWTRRRVVACLRTYRLNKFEDQAWPLSTKTIRQITGFLQRSRLTSVEEDNTSDYRLPPRVKTDLCRRRQYVRLQASSKCQDWPLSTKTIRQITGFLQGSRLTSVDKDNTLDFRLPARAKTDLCRRRHYVRLQTSSKGEDWPLSIKTIRQITGFLQGPRLTSVGDDSTSDYRLPWRYK